MIICVLNSLYPPQGLDFWSLPSLTLSTVDVRVEGARLGDLEGLLRRLDLPYAVIVPDLQR